MGWMFSFIKIIILVKLANIKAKDIAKFDYVLLSLLPLFLYRTCRYFLFPDV